MKKNPVFKILLVLWVGLTITACAGISFNLQPPFAAPTGTPTALAPAQPAPAPTLAAPRSEPSLPEPPAGLLSQQEAYIQLYERVNPSVVNIRVVLKPGSGRSVQLPFELPNIPGFPQIPTPEAPTTPDQALGSGFVYDQNGHIVTNNHVVENAERIVVTFADGSEAGAQLVGADPDSDLAVIKVDAGAVQQLTPLPLGDSDALKVGQIVVAIGNPFGLQGSMSTGIISGLGRLLPAGAQAPGGAGYSIPDVIQTDTAINPGNSGGPLLNLQGEVIGVNTAIKSSVGVSSGVGYAVPSQIVALVIPELIENGSIEHPWLGITGRTLNADLATAMKLDPAQRGVLVAEVVSDSPAEKANLKGSAQDATIDGIPVKIGGDVIIRMDDRPIKGFDDLLVYIYRNTRPGQTVSLTILRDGKEQEVSVTLAARPKRPSQ